MLQDVDPAGLADIIRPLCKETADLLKPHGVDVQDALMLSMQDDNWFRASVRRHLNNGEYDKFPSGVARKWIASVPENKWNEKEDEYLIAATDLSCLYILASWPQQNIVASDTARKTLELLALRFIHQFNTSALPQAIFLQDKTLPDGAHENPLDCYGRMVKGTPADYQALAATCAANAEGGFGQFMDTGTGKTIVTIETVIKTIERLTASLGRPLRVLVVCPRQLRSNWGYELDKFSRLPYHFINCRGGKIDRAKHLIDLACTSGVDFAVMAISYGHAKGSIGTLLSLEWDLLIADESDNFKSHTTHTWKSMEKLRDASRKRIALTATPICNTLSDLWTQLEFLGKGYSGFIEWKAFRKFYCSFVSTGVGVQRLIGYQNVPLLKERLTRLSYSITIEEALPDLPETAHDVIEIELSDEQRDAYTQLKSTLRLEIEDRLENSDQPLVVTMNNVLTMLLRLAHVTSGFLTFDPLYDLDTGDLVRAKRIDRFDPNPKLEELIELIKNSRPNQKIIVWCAWVPSIRTIAARLDVEGINAVTFYGATTDDQREVAVQRFNNQSASECKVLCGNPACGGVGLNLLGQADADTNCDWIIDFDYDWSWRKRKQGHGRNRRRGTRVMQRTTTLVAANSIDEQIYDVLMAKKDTAMQLQDLRALLHQVLEL